jgi:putative transposase
MVIHPAEYPWGSYRFNAQGETHKGLTAHPLYLALAGTRASRQLAYRELFRCHLDPELVDDIRQSTNSNYALGSERFKDEVEAALGRRVRPGVSGRPREQS